MHRQTKITLALLALSVIFTNPAYAQTKEVGIYGIWTDRAQYDPDQNVTVTVELAWDFPSETGISPGVYDVMAEAYIAEDIYTVANAGVDNVTLSFTAPSTNGVYEYIVNVFYDDEGWQQSSTGFEEHYIYIQVGSTGSGEYSAWITDVEAPDTVAPSEQFNVTVHIEMSFPTLTRFSVAVTDPDTGEALIDVEDQAEGDQKGIYWFELTAPDTEGEYTLGADIIFETQQGWTFSEGAAQSFEVKVKTGGGGIPGFPVMSVLVGSLVALGLLFRRREHV